jgi:hypothetical protein
MRDTIIRELKPKGQLELELVSWIASILWRLRRVPIFETLLMAGLSIETFFKSDFSGKIGRYETTLQRQLPLLSKTYAICSRVGRVRRANASEWGFGLEIVSPQRRGE